MSGVTAPINTGGGGLDAGSSAASQSGDIRSGDKAYGGINIAPAAGGFQLPTTTILIGVGLAALYFFAKKKKYI